MNPNRASLATVEEMQESMYAGIHTMQISLQKRGGDFCKAVNENSSIVNVNKYARERGMTGYYIESLEKFCDWFRRYVTEFYPENPQYTIQRLDVMADNTDIPWKRRRKWDIAVLYAMQERYGDLPDDRRCVLYRYNNRDSSIKVNIGRFEVATYDRTKIEHDVSGVSDRLEFRLKNIRLSGTQEERVTDISQLNRILSGLGGKLLTLDFNEANTAAARDILAMIEAERLDGGRDDRKFSELIEEEEYRMFSTGEAQIIGRAFNVNRQSVYNMMARQIPAKISGADFRKYVRLISTKIGQFVDG